jgi:hypothetical protein
MKNYGSRLGACELVRSVNIIESEALNRVMPPSHNRSPRFLPSERPGRDGYRGTRSPI